MPTISPLGSNADVFSNSTSAVTRASRASERHAEAQVDAVAEADVVGRVAIEPVGRRVGSPFLLVAVRRGEEHQQAGSAIR